MTTNKTVRRCNGKTCITILSRYNDDPNGLCGPCRRAHNDAAIERFREQMAQREQAIADKAAADAAPTPKRKRRSGWTPDLLLEELARWKALGFNRAPTATEIVEKELPHRSNYVRHFGTWAKACELAGLSAPPVPKRLTGSRELVVEIVEEADGPLTIEQIARRMRLTEKSVTKRNVRDVCRRLAVAGRISRIRSPAGGAAFLYSPKDGA